MELAWVYGHLSLKKDVISSVNYLVAVGMLLVVLTI